MGIPFNLGFTDFEFDFCHTIWNDQPQCILTVSEKVHQ